MFNQLDGAFPMVSEFHPNAFTAETRAGMSPLWQFLCTAPFLDLVPLPSDGARTFHRPFSWTNARLEAR